MNIVSGQAEFTADERDAILKVVRITHPGRNSMKAALRVIALDFSRLDLSPEEISRCKALGGSDNLIVAMCKVVRMVPK